MAQQTMTYDNEKKKIKKVLTTRTQYGNIKNVKGVNLMTKNFTKECVLNGNTRHLKEVMKTKSATRPKSIHACTLKTS